MWRRRLLLGETGSWARRPRPLTLGNPMAGASARKAERLAPPAQIVDKAEMAAPAMAVAGRLPPPAAVPAAGGAVQAGNDLNSAAPTLQTHVDAEGRTAVPKGPPVSIAARNPGG